MKVYHFNKEKNKNGILMDMGYSKDVPNFNFSGTLHTASFFEILIINKGKGTLWLDTQKINFSRGTFIFISPYQKRKWITNTDALEAYFIIFEPDFLNSFFSDKFFVYRLQYFYNQSILPYFLPNERLFSFEGDIFEEIKNEIQESTKDSAHLLRSILYYILIKLNRKFCEFHHINSDFYANDIAFQFKELLQKNIKTHQQVNDYAILLNISRISLNHSVKKQFNINASEMIHNQLLFEIKDQILYSNKTIAEIAYDFNFNEPQHLHRFFKRLTKQTPLEYRMSYQNGYIK